MALYMFDRDAVEWLLFHMKKRYGSTMAFMIWRYAADCATEAGEDRLSVERLKQAEREYFGRQ